MSTRAAFLDRDGTIIVDKPYVSDPAQVELVPGAPGALELLQSKGFRLVVVSNQSGVARGFFTEADIAAVNRRMLELLGPAVRIEKIYYCPHLPEGIRPEYAITCDCRKPEPGMLRRAERELGIDLSQSVVIGDSLRDVMAGRRVGAKTVMVLTGQGAEFVKTFGEPSEADRVVPNLLEAARWVT